MHFRYFFAPEIFLSSLLLKICSAQFFLNLLQISLDNTYALLNRREVKMAVYWPSSFCVIMYRDEVDVHQNAKKTNRANIQPS